MKIKHLMLVSLFLGMTGVSWKASAQNYSYGPACQWIRLTGEVVPPPGEGLQPPYTLSVTYQLRGMKRPALLLTRQRLNKAQFAFYFSGFDEEIEEVRFVPPEFFFAEEITFRYFARSADGKWRSPDYETVWTPTPVPILDTPATRAREYRCHTEVALQTLFLEKNPRRRK